jgi:hypothetical protein
LLIHISYIQRFLLDCFKIKSIDNEILQNCKCLYDREANILYQNNLEIDKEEKRETMQDGKRGIHNLTFNQNRIMHLDGSSFNDEILFYKQTLTAVKKN